ncbi:MAG: YbjQ family protein [Deltaproteobacteria bacterium]|nr:YbjQ family protein [Deltaproteobacteria bacterium]
MFELIVFLILTAAGYIMGTLAEKKHYKSIEAREKKFIKMAAVNFKTLPSGEIKASRFALGNVVVSIDYFKRILAGLRNIFGGSVASYETLVDRARREAILRMKESVPGADMIINVRIETSTIGKNANRRKQIGSVEALAYGTAIKFKEKA